MKKRIISLCVICAIVLGYLGLTKILKKEETVLFGKSGGSIINSENDICDGNCDILVAKNSSFEMYIDRFYNPYLRHIETNKIWKSVSKDDMGNTNYSSSLIIDYFNDLNSMITLNSFEHSVSKGQARAIKIDNGVKIEYLFGEASVEYIYPPIISKKRMAKFLKRMNKEDRKFVMDSYSYIDIDEYTGADRKYLLEEYPRLEKEDIFVATGIETKSIKNRINDIFIWSGYSKSEQTIDNEGKEVEKVNPQTFKISVSYILTDSGFKASVNAKDLEFYSDYPLTSIKLLPYFDSFAGNDSGYLTLASGSGALLDMGNNGVIKELSFPIYGNNLSLTKQITNANENYPLPVYGQYRNGAGYMCIVTDGAQQATVTVDKNDMCSACGVKFTVIDSESCAMSTQNPVELFADDISDSKYTVDYTLFPKMDEKTAYSDIANAYRKSLIDDGLINPDNSNRDPIFLAEFIGSVNYKDMFLGCIPVKKEYSLTDFDEAEKTAVEIDKLSAGNTKVLFTGWNANGLNRQSIKKLSVSKASGGKSSFNTVLDNLKKRGIESYAELNFSSVSHYSLDGYDPSSNSARSINNNIVHLTTKDYLTYELKDTDFQLVSPNMFTKIWKSFDKKFKTCDSGIYVSDMTAMLYGDYTNEKMVTRKSSADYVTKTLGEIKKSKKNIMGKCGNLYSLPYLKVINNLSISSNNSNYFDKDIPFVQMVLHGSVDYVSEAINNINEQSDTVLKLIETGSGVHYLLTNNTFDELFNTEFSYLYNTNYSNMKKSLNDIYSSVSGALKGLGNVEITEHQYITDDVVLVKYKNGTEIYINYGLTDYFVGKDLVRAKDYLRIN